MICITEEPNFLEQLFWKAMMQIYLEAPENEMEVSHREVIERSDQISPLFFLSPEVWFNQHILRMAHFVKTKMKAYFIEFSKQVCLTLYF